MARVRRTRTRPCVAPANTGPCAWDCCDLDNNIGILDLLNLLAQWDGGGSCDFDGSGVGIVDFLKLLANWGPCP